MFRKTKTTTDFEPSTDVFPSIATAPLARKFKLEKIGASDGKQNYPSDEATGLTTAEQEAVSEITRLRKRGIDAFDTHFNAYQSRIDLSQSAVSQIDVEAGKLRNEMVSEGNTRQNIVMNKLRAVREFNEGLEAFRRRHRLTAPPKDSQSLWIVVLIIFVFFAVEIILGALFFQEHSPGGIVGSATYAVMISLVNVAISGLLGHCSRYVTLCGFWNRFGGILSIATFMIFAIAFNLFVGHYRRATDEMPWEEAAYTMFDSFISAPFNLGSFNAILIAVFGLVVSVFAFIKARSWEDVHPGYNRAYDAVHDAIEDYGEAFEETEEMLNKLFDESRERLLGEAHALRAIVRGAANAHVGQTTLVGNLDAFLNECEQVANALLRTYREANERNRTEPVPGYFRESIVFPAPKHQHVSKLASDRVDREVTRINEAADRGVRDILEARQKQLSTLPTSDQLLHGLDIGVMPRTTGAPSFDVPAGDRD